MWFQKEIGGDYEEEEEEEEEQDDDEEEDLAQFLRKFQVGYDFSKSSGSGMPLGTVF